jgi:hypothetical protein
MWTPSAVDDADIDCRAPHDVTQLARRQTMQARFP